VALFAVVYRCAGTSGSIERGDGSWCWTMSVSRGDCAGRPRDSWDGSVMTNRHPCPDAVRSVMVPPWAWTIDWAMASQMGRRRRAADSARRVGARRDEDDRGALRVRPGAVAAPSTPRRDQQVRHRRGSAQRRPTGQQMDSGARPTLRRVIVVRPPPEQSSPCRARSARDPAFLDEARWQ
jgi:hypothetical protein